MSQAGPLSLSEHFEGIDDPRVERGKEYKPLDIIVIVLCAVIFGTDDWVAIAGWGTRFWKFCGSSYG